MYKIGHNSINLYGKAHLGVQGCWKCTKLMCEEKAFITVWFNSGSGNFRINVGALLFTKLLISFSAWNALLASSIFQSFGTAYLVDIGFLLPFLLTWTCSSSDLMLLMLWATLLLASDPKLLLSCDLSWFFFDLLFFLEFLLWFLPDLPIFPFIFE